MVCLCDMREVCEVDVEDLEGWVLARDANRATPLEERDMVSYRAGGNLKSGFWCCRPTATGKTGLSCRVWWYG